MLTLFSIPPTHGWRQVHGVTGPAADYVWNIVPALNKNARAISFESTNFPGKYVIPIGGQEAGRLGLGAPGTDLDAVSFTVVDGLGNATALSFRSMAKATQGFYLAADGRLQGSCHYPAPSTDLALIQTPATNADATFR